jgi:hypothetical protein
MKQFLLILFFELFFLQSYSQVNFEKAYFIDNNNVRTECFIKNKDLYNNPNTFEYKLDREESVAMIADINDVKEFGILNSIKFERNLVKMDMSTSDLGQMKDIREPEWKDKTLFLKVLIEGKASLYEYRDKTMKRYFYKLDNLPVTQLIYKKYYMANTSNMDLAVNNDFQKQIWEKMNCENQTMNAVLKLEYDREDLANYFIKYNSCKNDNFTDYNKNIAKGSFNIKAKGGINMTPYENYDNAQQKVEYFGNKFFLKYGGEFEYVTPFNRNKWAIFMELTYQTYKYYTITTEHSSSGVLFENTYKSNYFEKSVFPFIGFRYYMYLKNDSKIFVNAGLFKTFGFGYSYNNKYNVEIRSTNTGLSKYSIVFGYTLFNNKKK